MPTGKPGTSIRQTFICEHCQQPFERVVYPSSARQSQFRFCSPTCRNKARVKREIPCPVCGRPFKPYQHGKRDKPKQFCSQYCANIAATGKKRPRLWTKELDEQLIDLYPNHLPQETAAIMGLSISQIQARATILKIHLKAELQKINSKRVNSLRMTLNNPGKGRPRIKHREYYRGSNWHIQRAKTLERDGYRCQVCNKKIGIKQRDYGIHHITPFRDFGDDYVNANRLSNLITLCRRCHAQVECGNVPCPHPLPFDQ